MASYPKAARMRGLQHARLKLDLDFTDGKVMSVAGLALVAQAAYRLGLRTLLDGFAPCKRYNAGFGDQKNIMTPIGCLLNFILDRTG